MPRQSDSLHRGLSKFLQVDGAFDSTCCNRCGLRIDNVGT